MYIAWARFRNEPDPNLVHERSLAIESVLMTIQCHSQGPLRRLKKKKKYTQVEDKLVENSSIKNLT